MPNIQIPLNPSTTDFETIYEVISEDDRADINKINIANVSDNDALYSIAKVQPGQEVETIVAWAWNIKIKTGANRLLLVDFVLDDFGERLMVRSSIANAITFIISGDYR